MQANPPLEHDRATPAVTRRAPRPWTLALIALICAIPFPLAATLYFAPVWFAGVPVLAALAERVTPDGKSNYGELVEPQRPMPRLAATTLAGVPLDLAALRGKWIMLTLGHGACDEACARRLYVMRQVRASTAKDQLRIERVLLVDGTEPIAPGLLAAYEGTLFARIDPAQIAAWLPAAAQGGDPADHVYLVDPLGNLMMRWPAAGDPVRLRKDLVRLLFASGIG